MNPHPLNFDASFFAANDGQQTSQNDTSSFEAPLTDDQQAVNYVRQAANLDDDAFAWMAGLPNENYIPAFNWDSSFDPNLSLLPNGTINHVQLEAQSNQNYMPAFHGDFTIDLNLHHQPNGTINGVQLEAQSNQDYMPAFHGDYTFDPNLHHQPSGTINGVQLKTQNNQNYMPAIHGTFPLNANLLLQPNGTINKVQLEAQIRRHATTSVFAQPGSEYTHHQYPAWSGSSYVHSNDAHGNPTYLNSGVHPQHTPAYRYDNPTNMARPHSSSLNPGSSFQPAHQNTGGRIDFFPRMPTDPGTPFSQEYQFSPASQPQHDLPLPTAPARRVSYSNPQDQYMPTQVQQHRPSLPTQNPNEQCFPSPMANLQSSVPFQNFSGNRPRPTPPQQPPAIPLYTQGETNDKKPRKQVSRTASITCTHHPPCGKSKNGLPRCRAVRGSSLNKPGAPTSTVQPRSNSANEFGGIDQRLEPPAKRRRVGPEARRESGTG